MFSVLVYNPIYNALVYFIDIIPGGDVGLALIVVTVLVRLILSPLAHKVARTQLIIRRIQPQIDTLKELHKDDKQAQTLKTLELYKENHINPLLGIVVLAIQIPIMLGLYWVFAKGGLPSINADVLYTFVPVPTLVDMHFLGLLDIAGKSAILAVLAGVAQFINMQLVMPKAPEPKENPSLQDDFARSMHIQMKFVMPVIITVFAYTTSAALALYWLVTSLFTIGQELLVRKQLAHEG